MKSTISRGQLLAGAALGFGLAFAPQQAQAACTVSPVATPVTGTITCADTTTGDTTYAGVSPASDRNYNVDTSGGDVTGTISAGATVDDFGLSFTNTVGGANDIIIVNNGAVEYGAANGTPTQGVDAALGVLAIGATNIDYSGDGDIINLGSGAGLGVQNNGTGTVIIDTAGAVTSTTAEGIVVRDTATGGDISVTTGDVTTSALSSNAIDVRSDSTAGDVTITANGVLSATDVAVVGTINDSAATGDISITTNDAVNAFQAVFANNQGSGSISITAAARSTGGVERWASVSPMATRNLLRVCMTATGSSGTR